MKRLNPFAKETPAVVEEDLLENLVADQSTHTTDQKISLDSPPDTKMERFKTWAVLNRKKITLVSAVVLIPVMLFLTIGVVIGLKTLSVARQLQQQAAETEVLGREAYASFKAQDLPTTQAKFVEVETKLGEVRSTYEQLSFYNAIPFANRYYQDGVHGLNAADAGLSAGKKTVDAIVPYADVLGFSGEGSFTGGTAEERVRLIIQTLEKITPILDDISADLEIMETELAQIDENRYPEEFKGKPVRAQLLEIKQVASGANTVMKEYRPVIEILPQLAGANQERKKYLVLFQNDNELRATGGFLTAYSTIFVEDGKVTPEKSDDIYELDKKFRSNIPIPESLGRYLTTEKYFNLRDMNISPDFKTAMDLFYENYKDLPGEPTNVDGIIAIDTHVLTELLTIVGPVEVPGYGTFSAEIDPRCDCPMVIYALSEIITRPTPYLRDDRKGILGPMMKTILSRIYASPRIFLADLFSMTLDSVEGRHMQGYFFDENQQKAMETIGAAGRMIPPQDGDDFFAVINSNLGGAKSNLFVTYEALHEITGPENGEITHTVTLTYKNPRAGDNCNLEAGLLCLNSTLRDWTRIYLPDGAKLVDSQGFNEEPKVYDEAGFKVVDGFFILEPKNQAKVVITYTFPYDQEEYQLRIWKQGGIETVPSVIDVNGGQEEVIVDQDIEYQVEF